MSSSTNICRINSGYFYKTVCDTGWSQRGEMFPNQKYVRVQRSLKVKMAAVRNVAALFSKSFLNVSSRKVIYPTANVASMRWISTGNV